TPSLCHEAPQARSIEVQSVSQERKDPLNPLVHKVNGKSSLVALLIDAPATAARFPLHRPTHLASTSPKKAPKCASHPKTCNKLPHFPQKSETKFHTPKPTHHTSKLAKAHTPHQQTRQSRAATPNSPKPSSHSELAKAEQPQQTSQRREAT